jgi:hypothetical protein
MAQDEHGSTAPKKSGIVATPGVVSAPIYFPLKSQILKSPIPLPHLEAQQEICTALAAVGGRGLLGN